MYWKLICCVALIYSLQACKGKSTEKVETNSKTKRNNGPLRVEAFIVKPTVLNQSIDVPGNLLPFEITEIHPEVSGKIVMLSIREGSFVSRGALLAKLFDKDLQAQLRKDQVQLQINQKTQERQRQLLQIGGISQQDYDLSILNLSTVRADMQVLQANIAKTVIRAPFTGKIGFVNVTIGSYVTPQTVISTISQINKLKLEFSVPEKYASAVALGQYVTFTVEGSPKKYSARVIATEASITEMNRSLKVRAQVDAVDKYVAAGSFAKVIFDMGENNQALMVPTQAIIPGARDKKIIVNRHGTATFQTVVTGVRDSANVQIVSGIAAGDTVITTGILQLKPGNKIIIAPIKNNKQ